MLAEFDQENQMEVFDVALLQVKVRERLNQKFTQLLGVTLIFYGFVDNLIKEQSNGRLSEIGTDRLIWMNAPHLLDAQDGGVLPVINHQVEQCEWLVKRNFIFTGLASDSIDDVGL